jgi:hypothetical protein
VSSGEDDVSNTDALTNKRKAPDDDDAEDGGASSAEPISPDPIRSNTSEQADSSLTYRAASIVHPASGRGCKRPTTAIRQNQPLPSVDQVMSQIELPLYHGPRSPLDLIIVEIIFRRLFETFRHISQAATTDPSTYDKTRPQKKTLHSSLRKVLVPR